MSPLRRPGLQEEVKIEKKNGENRQEAADET
jgi:hypothetical protein